MIAQGTVTAIRRHVTPHGSVYVTLTLNGNARFKFLHFGPAPVKGDRISIAGTPMMHGHNGVNIGGASIHKLSEA